MSRTRPLAPLCALLVLGASCGSDGTDAMFLPQSRASVHEHELADQPNLRGSLCVTLDSRTIAEASIHDATGDRVAHLGGGTTTATVNLQAGEYTLRLASSGRRDEIYFVRPSACGFGSDDDVENRAALSASAPGVYIHPVPTPDSIVQVTTSTTAFVGHVGTGPTGTATLVTSFNDFTTTFGHASASNPVSLAVGQFFEYGGSTAYVVGTESASGSTPSAADLLPAGILAGESSLAAVHYDLLVLPDLAQMSESDALEVISYAAGLAACSNVFFLMDYPLTIDTTEEIQKFVTSDVAALKLEGGAAHTALYFPPVEIFLPTGARATVGLGGILAGVLARASTSTGVRAQPAGPGNGALLDVTLSLALNATELGTLNAVSINPIRPPTGGEAPTVWGSRTLAAPGTESEYIATRRLMTMVTKSITEGLEWTAFDENHATKPTIRPSSCGRATCGSTSASQRHSRASSSRIRSSSRRRRAPDHPPPTPSPRRVAVRRRSTLARPARSF